MGRLERLEQRRLDSSVLVKASMANEVYREIRESESVRYAIGAMQPIDPEYTRNTFLQGDRVKSQLKERLAQECEFEYQGSTTTDTHIKVFNDTAPTEIYNKGKLNKEILKASFAIPTNTWDVALIVAAKNLGGFTSEIDNMLVARTIGFR